MGVFECYHAWLQAAPLITGDARTPRCCHDSIRAVCTVMAALARARAADMLSLTHTCTRPHTCTHAHTCTRACTYAGTQRVAAVLASRRSRIDSTRTNQLGTACMCVCLCVCVHVCVLVCVRVHMCVRTLQISGGVSDRQQKSCAPTKHDRMRSLVRSHAITRPTRRVDEVRVRAPAERRRSARSNKTMTKTHA